MMPWEDPIPLSRTRETCRAPGEDNSHEEWRARPRQDHANVDLDHAMIDAARTLDMDDRVNSFVEAYVAASSQSRPDVDIRAVLLHALKDCLSPICT